MYDQTLSELMTFPLASAQTKISEFALSLLMFLEKNIYLNAHFSTGSSREIIAEFSGLREAEEHGQQSRDHQKQRAGNYTQETSKHHFDTSYLIISCMKIKTKTKLCLVDGPSCKIHRGHARRL